MPGAGKSTNGLLLAKALGKDFLDTDVLIQVREDKTLQQIMDNTDHLILRQIEASVLISIDTQNSVIATGGSAVYSAAGMAHFSGNSIIVYLDTPLQILQERIHDYETRGIACHPDQSFDELFTERTKLYRRYADITINCDQHSPEDVVGSIIKELDERK
ncbi:MAG: shikimate kinase [Porticoccus sp.]|nr:shikimate kinase [Porticoccus sp.]MBQ0807229.1 shikimate kinase [Porticoccus sp.]